LDYCNAIDNDRIKIEEANDDDDESEIKGLETGRESESDSDSESDSSTKDKKEDNKSLGIWMIDNVLTPFLDYSQIALSWSRRWIWIGSTSFFLTIVPIMLVQERDREFDLVYSQQMQQNASAQGGATPQSTPGVSASEPRFLPNPTPATT